MTRWTESDENLVAEVLHSYAQNGTIRWVSAWKDHPEWKEQLTKDRTLGAVLVKGHEMKKKMEGGRLKKAAKMAKAEKPKPSGKKNWERWTDQQNHVIAEVVKQYATGKGDDRYVDYAAAWKDHPDWRDVLGSKSANAIHSKGQKLLHGTQVAVKLNGKRTLVDLVDKEPVVVAAKTVIEPKWQVNACPHCTNNLSLMMASYAKQGGPMPTNCPFCTFPISILKSAINFAVKHPLATV